MASLDLVCAVVGAYNYSTFTIDVRLSDTIGNVKVDLKKALPDYIIGASPESVLLFPAKRNREFLPLDSPEMDVLRKGETDGVQDLLKRELLLNSDDRVGECFGDMLGVRCYHVLIASAVRKLRCVVIGASHGELCISIDVRKPMQSLYQAVSIAAKIPEEGLRVFFPIGPDGKWVCCGFGEADDSWALGMGRTTKNIEYMLRPEMEVHDPFALVGVPDDEMRNLHLLVVSPSFAPRKSLIPVLGQRTRHLDVVSDSLSELTSSGETGPLPMSKIPWWKLWNQYETKSYRPSCMPVQLNLVAALQRELREKTRITYFPDEDSRQVDLLVSIVLQHAVRAGLGININPKYRLESNLGVLDVTGHADFMISRGDKYVSVMGAVDPETFEDDVDEGEGDEHERVPEDQLQLQRMETGLAHAIIAMEIVNSYPPRFSMGIVTNYFQWWFLKLDYEGNLMRPLVLIDNDCLTHGDTEEEDLARIVGKIVSMVDD